MYFLNKKAIAIIVSLSPSLDVTSPFPQKILYNEKGNLSIPILEKLSNAHTN
jgi:hypothetical protein